MGSVQRGKMNVSSETRFLRIARRIFPRGRVSQAMLAAAPEVFRDQAGLAGLAAFIRSVARS